MNKYMYLPKLTVALAIVISSCQTESSHVDPDLTAAKSAKMGGDKVTLAHSAGKGFKAISVGQDALSTHLAHGDYYAVDFHIFHIRKSDGSIVPKGGSSDSNILLKENPEGDGFSANTPDGGQKVGYGTNAFDGMQVNKLETVNWNKVYGISNGVGAYLNIWVTDGINYAIIASENDYVGKNFGTRQEWKVFEYPDKSNPNASLDWLFENGAGRRDDQQYLTRNGTRVTLAELKDNITIVDPYPSYPDYVGTGAPRGGYGFNLIWGDTQNNFVGGNKLNNLTLVVDGLSYRAINIK